MKTKVKEALLEARKKKDNVIADLMRTVLGEFDRVGKDITNEKCEKIVRNLAKDCADHDETVFLTNMLPKLMTKDEIHAAMIDIYEANNFIKLPEWVTEWNKLYKGKADMKLVMIEIKEFMKLPPY